MNIHPPEIKVFDSAVTRDSEVAIGVLKVSPVNLDLKDDQDQEALHLFFQEVLDTITYPIYIHSRQTPADLEGYMNRIDRNDGYSELRSEYIEHCRRVASEGFVNTDHFIVIHVAGGKHDDAGRELERRLHEVRLALSGGELDIFHVTGSDLQEFADEIRNPAPNPLEDYLATPNDGFDEYRKMVYVAGYPAELDFGWPRHIQQVDGFVDITQVFRPVDEKTAVKTLRRQSETLAANIAGSRAQGFRGVNDREQSLDGVERFLDRLAMRECRPLEYGVYITAHGPTQAEVEETFRQVETRLHALRLEYEEPGYRNDHAYYTDSPLYDDRLDETLMASSDSAALGMPFGNQPFEDENGVLYGVTEDGTPILIDRFSWNSHSMAVMGTLGSGKSYLSHLELLRSLLLILDLRIIVVDPKKEYRATVEALGGDHRLIESGTEYSFDQQVIGFEVEERGELENVETLVDLVQQIYSAASKNRDRTIVLIDEAHNLLDDEAGRFLLNQFVLEARDINVAVHMVTQSWSHFADYDKGADILNHVPGKVFFRHEEAPDTSILSRQEELDIKGLRTAEEARYSEAYLHVANTINTKIKIESTPPEHQIFEEDREE